jgi:hypothetical protein
MKGFYLTDRQRTVRDRLSAVRCQQLVVIRNLSTCNLSDKWQIKKEKSLSNALQLCSR